MTDDINSNQSGHVTQAAQTNIGGNVYGPVLSGQFNGPVNIGEPISFNPDISYHVGNSVKGVDAAILTVLPEEYDAICSKVRSLKRWPGDEETNNIYAWQTGIVISSTSSTAYSVAIGMTGRAGNTKSTAATIEAIRLWRPRYIFFIGIAGGLSGLTKGDVIIADVIHGYEYGKIDDEGFLPRPNWTYPTDIGLFTGATAYALQTDWRRLKKLKPPIKCNSDIIIGEIASGDKVVDNPSDSFFEQVLKAYPKIKAVEMEGAGASEAIKQAHAQGKAIGFLMIRGISDMPRQKRDEAEVRGSIERDDWKPYAADAAAAFAIGYIASGLPTPPSREKSRSEILEPSSPRLFNIPDLPTNFLPRPDDIQHIKELLFGDTKPTGITGASLKYGVQGMGGIGKSVIAAAMAHDLEIQKAFPDGIFWITIGSSEPNLLQRQSDLAFALSDRPWVFNDIEQGRSQLSKLLAGKTCLIILDDVWQVEDADAFNSLGSGSKMLITTRDAAVINGLGAKAHSLDLLNQNEAKKLLADWAGMLPDSMPLDATDIVDECGYLPLAVAMIGAMLKGKPIDRWKNALNKFRSSNLDNIAYKFPKYPYPSLLKAIQVSIDALESGQEEKYLDFAVFPEDTPIPEAVLHTFWAEDLDHDEIQDFLDLLVDRSLARRDNYGRLILHDLQFDFVRKKAINLQSLHVRLLNSYREKCAEGWPFGPNDGYFFQHIAFHLNEAGRYEELDHLLLNFEWIRSKLDATNINSLLADYVFSTKNEDLQMIANALKLSSFVLAIDKNQLPSQLYGRLIAQDSPIIKKMLIQVKPRRGELWLYPIASSLRHPGESLFATLGRHKSMVVSVAVARNSQHDIVISGSADQTLRAWDLSTGQLLKTLEGHKSRVNAVAITHDGRRAISASADGTIKVWNIRNGQPLKTLAGTKGQINNFRTIALTRDDNRLISGSEDKLIRIWDLNTGKIIKTLSGHSELVSKIVLTQNDKYAISASYDKTIKLWDLETGHVIKTFEGHIGQINALAITPDDKLAISGSKDKTIRIWDLETGSQLKTLEGHNQRILSLAITHDGRHVVSTSADMTIKVWDIVTGEVLDTLRGHSDKINGIAITPDDRFAVSASADSTINIWDLRAIEHPKTLGGHSRSINRIITTTDGRCAVTASNDQTIKIWDLETGHAIRTLADQKARFTDIALTSDNRCLISASNDRKLRIWDFNSGDLLKALRKHEHQVNLVVLTPDDHRAISASIDRTIKIWDLSEGKLLHSLEGHSEVINSLVLTADGHCAISASSDRTIRIWDIDHGQLLKIFTGHTDNINAVILTHSGRNVVSASEDRTLRIWNITNGSTIGMLEGHTDKINAIAITADDQHVVSGSADKTLKIWNLSTCHLDHTLIGHAGWVNAVALMPNDQFAISASNDKTIKIWDIQTGKNIATFTADGPINTFAVTPDGTKIIAGDTVGSVHVLRFEKLNK